MAVRGCGHECHRDTWIRGTHRLSFDDDFHPIPVQALNPYNVHELQDKLEYFREQQANGYTVCCVCENGEGFTTPLCDMCSEREHQYAAERDAFTRHYHSEDGTRQRRQHRAEMESFLDHQLHMQRAEEVAKERQQQHLHEAAGRAVFASMANTHELKKPTGFSKWPKAEQNSWLNQQTGMDRMKVDIDRWYDEQLKPFRKHQAKMSKLYNADSTQKQDARHWLAVKDELRKILSPTELMQLNSSGILDGPDAYRPGTHAENMRDRSIDAFLTNWLFKGGAEQDLSKGAMIGGKFVPPSELRSIINGKIRSAKATGAIEVSSISCYLELLRRSVEGEESGKSRPRPSQRGNTFDYMPEARVPESAQYRSNPKVESFQSHSRSQNNRNFRDSHVSQESVPSQKMSDPPPARIHRVGASSEAAELQMLILERGKEDILDADTLAIFETMPTEEREKVLRLARMIRHS